MLGTCLLCCVGLWDLGASEFGACEILGDKRPLKGFHLNTKTKTIQMPANLNAHMPHTNPSTNQKHMLYISRQATQSHTEPTAIRNTLLDTTLLFIVTRSSSIHQNTGTSPPNKETFTKHWSNLTHRGQTPQVKGTTILQAAERRTQTQWIKQNENTEKNAADGGIW